MGKNLQDFLKITIYSLLLIINICYNVKVMALDLLTKDKVVFFFNKYKYNNDLIYRLERRILKESEEFQKWEHLLIDNSQLTRKLFIENMAMLNAYILPAIENPESLRPDTIETFLLHITFFLFENNIDSLVTDDLLNAFLAHPNVLNSQTRFSTLMNLGISKTMALRGNFKEIYGLFEEALQIFPTMTSTNNPDISVHLIFCRTYQMLAFDLFDTDDYASFLYVYNKTEELLSTATSEIMVKMWGTNVNFDFQKKYLMRFFRLYGIFLANKNDFNPAKNNSPESTEALNTIISWVEDEFKAQEQEGHINSFIFTSYHKQRKALNIISEEEYQNTLLKKFDEVVSSEDLKPSMIFPDLSFPDDANPEPQFAKMMDRMKLFNKSFSYTFVFLQELLEFSDDERIFQEIYRYFQFLKYADKGFTIDKFVLKILQSIAKKLTSVEKFLHFTQTIFIRRQISSAIHIRMVSSISGICFSHFIQKRPDLFIIPGRFNTAEEVSEHKDEVVLFLKTGAILHDLGKLSITNLINLHFREITDNEFARIKTHAAMGASLIKDFPYIAAYKDFMQGHHKYWNDSRGYPESFHIQDSPIKYYVGLICLADCIDSMTDYTGRNYARKKTFDDVLEEFEAQAGTRYCPELIQMLLEDEILQEELRILTSQDGRNYNSYQIYHDFIEPTTIFLESDERTISPLNPELEKNLLEFYSACFKKTPQEKILRHINEITNDHNARLLVMHNSENKILGVIGGHPVTPLSDEETYFFITDMFIRPEYMRKGYGTELLIAMGQSMKTENISKIKVNVQKDLSVETFFWISGFIPNNDYLMEKIIN